MRCNITPRLAACGRVASGVRQDRNRTWHARGPRAASTTCNTATASFCPQPQPQVPILRALPPLPATPTAWAAPRRRGARRRPALAPLGAAPAPAAPLPLEGPRLGCRRLAPGLARWRAAAPASDLPAPSPSPTALGRCCRCCCAPCHPASPPPTSCPVPPPAPNAASPPAHAPIQYRLPLAPIAATASLFNRAALHGSPPAHTQAHAHRPPTPAPHRLCLLSQPPPKKNRRPLVSCHPIHRLVPSHRAPLAFSRYPVSKRCARPPHPACLLLPAKQRPRPLAPLPPHTYNHAVHDPRFSHT